MSSNSSRYFLLIFPLIFAGCTEPSGYHVSEYREIKVEELSDDIRIPSKAWDMIEFKPIAEAASHAEHGGESGQHGEASAEGGHGEGGGEKAGPEKSVIFSEVSVFLVQKNDDIVDGGAVKIHLPKGGGTIDLSRYITDQRGSFYLGFEFPKFEGATAKKVVFVSRAKKRRIGSQIFGAGCNQVLDITEKFTAAMAKDGLKLNTTQDRYISVIGGTFLFSAQQGNDTLIAQVTFKNPQLQALFCEEK